MVEGRDDQSIAARFPGNRIRAVGRTFCPGCCCPTSEYPRSDQRRKKSHYAPHVPPPFRSANRLIRSATGPILGCHVSWCQEALDGRLRRRDLGKPFLPPPDVLLDEHYPQFTELWRAP